MQITGMTEPCRNVYSGQSAYRVSMAHSGSPGHQINSELLEYIYIRSMV